MDNGNDERRSSIIYWTTATSYVCSNSDNNTLEKRHKVRELIKAGHRLEALEELVKNAKDNLFEIPLFSSHFGEEDATAFHEASKRGDLELLLQLVAHPAAVGDAWTYRYMISQNKMIHVPVRARDCIRSPSSLTGSFFQDGYGISMEGLEVMLMYGYKITTTDIEGICSLFALDEEYYLPILKLSLAAAALLKKSDEKDNYNNNSNDDDDNDDYDNIMIQLEHCLGYAIGGTHAMFEEHTNNNNSHHHPTSITLAKILLQAGANPNGNCFRGTNPHDFCPALYQAVCNGDKEMVQFLMEYGADPSVPAKKGTWVGEWVITSLNPRDVAKDENIGKMLLHGSSRPQHGNFLDYQKQLRQELVQELKLELSSKYSAIIDVACMSKTGKAPPRLFSEAMLAYYPLGFNLWEIVF